MPSLPLQQRLTRSGGSISDGGASGGDDASPNAYGASGGANPSAVCASPSDGDPIHDGGRGPSALPRA